MTRPHLVIIALYKQGDCVKMNKTKVVYSSCGEFDISQAAKELLAKKKHVHISNLVSIHKIDRHDSDLVSVVEELGELAWSSNHLNIIALNQSQYKIQAGYEGDEYEESVLEPSGWTLAQPTLATNLCKFSVGDTVWFIKHFGCAPATIECGKISNIKVIYQDSRLYSISFEDNSVYDLYENDVFTCKDEVIDSAILLAEDRIKGAGTVIDSWNKNIKQQQEAIQAFKENIAFLTSLKSTNFDPEFKFGQVVWVVLTDKQYVSSILQAEYNYFSDSSHASAEHICSYNFDGVSYESSFGDDAVFHSKNKAIDEAISLNNDEITSMNSLIANTKTPNDIIRYESFIKLAEEANSKLEGQKENV